MMGDMEKALKFKEEGNVLYGKKNYSQAYDKYTKAIKEDDTNAVLYANRAACLLAMKKYLDASSDARKATECDPTYSKGWARYAASLEPLNSWSDALAAYKRALATLPVENLTSADVRLRDQYSTKVKSIQAEIQRREAAPTRVQGPAINCASAFPWIRAKEMLPKLEKMKEYRSSAWVIYQAHEEFTMGVEEMNALTKDYRTGLAYGRMDAIDNITNGILRDRRAFHLEDPQWMKKYQDQMIFEATTKRAWQDDGPEVVLREAQQRVRTEGWDVIRHAISITVRGWILRAFLTKGLKRDSADAAQWYGYAIDFLERGRKIWKNVSKEDRGVVFEESFVRGVKALRLECYMEACFEISSKGDHPNFHLDQLIALADELIEDSTSGKKSLDEIRNQYDPGFFYSFYVYPLAEAFAIKARCFRTKSKYQSRTSDDRKANQRIAGELYMQAANELPDDEEHRCFYLSSAICALLRTGATLGFALPIIDTLVDCMPNMQHLWEHSALAMAGRDSELRRLKEFAEDARKKMKKGRLNEESQIRPDWLQGE